MTISVISVLSLTSQRIYTDIMLIISNRKITAHIPYLILFLLHITYPAFSEPSESGSYWQCLTASLPDLIVQPNVRDLTISSLACFDFDKLDMIKAIVASEQHRQNAVCRLYAELSIGCRDYLARCEQNTRACQTALSHVMPCLSHLSEAPTLLSAVKVNTAEALLKTMRDLRPKAGLCDEEMEYVEKQPPLWWDRFCNDYQVSPLSFYELNEYYYEVELAGQRAELLRRYAMAEPASENWQRVVVTMMGLESLDADDPNERAAAAKVLGPHGDFSKPILYKLLTALNDPEPAVRANAALSLRVQGNRKSLVVFSLLSKLLDPHEPPEVRGNVALALREQAVHYPCQPHEEATYRLEGSEHPDDLVNGVPVCVPFDQQAHDQAEQEPDWWGELETNEKGCGNRPFANLFDRQISIAQIKDFNIIQNLCYVGVKMRSSKIKRLVRDILFSTLQAEEEPVAKAKMVAAMRTLGTPVNGDETIIQWLRFHSLNDSDYRVRRATLFALARAAKNEDWLLTQVIPQALEDHSPSVRKAAIAATSELITLSLSKKDTVYQAYVNGMTFHDSQATDCESSDQVDPKASTPTDSIESKFYTEGFKAAYLFYQDQCADSTDLGKPILAYSKPEMGEQGVSRRTDITLHFMAPVTEEMILSKIQLFGARQVIPYTIKSYQRDLKQRFTSVVLQMAEPLAPDQYYQLKFLPGFKFQDAPNQAPGYEHARSLLFKTVSSKVAQIIAAMMTDDPDVEVQYAAAEAFLARNEKAVLEFMKNKLFQNPPRNQVRAATYLVSPYFSYGPVQSLKPAERVSYLIDLLGKIKKHIIKQERMLKEAEVLTNQNPPPKDYLVTPALVQYYFLMNALLSQHWVTRKMKVEIEEALKLQAWILAKLKQDFPLRTYSYYERIYYSAIRNILKQIMNRHFISQVKHVDYLIYRDILMDEENGE
jgi:hypothetical protein